MALTKISTGGVKDDTADEAKLKVSNAGTNGQFLQKQSGNTGGLTWAAANEYTHPNHSGEVTSTGDGATVIASNIVDEDNLKISNAGTNGQFLQKQSGNTGGLTWADVTIPPAGNTVDLVADGAIAAGKPCIIKSNGKAAQVAEEMTARNNTVHRGTTWAYNAGTAIANDECRYAASINCGTNLIFSIWYNVTDSQWTSNVTYIDDTSNQDIKVKYSTGNTSNLGTIQSNADVDLAYLGNNKVCIFYNGASTNAGTALIATIDSTTRAITYGTAISVSATAKDLAVSYDTDNERILFSYTGNSSDNGYYQSASFSGTTITLLGSATAFALVSSNNGVRYIHSVYDTNADRHVVVYEYKDYGNKGYAFSVETTGSSMSASSLFEWSSSAINAVGPLDVCFDPINNRTVVAWSPTSGSAGKILGLVCNTSTGALTASGSVADTQSYSSTNFHADMFFNSISGKAYHVVGWQSGNHWIVVYPVTYNSSNGQYGVDSGNATSIWATSEVRKYLSIAGFGNASGDLQVMANREFESTDTNRHMDVQRLETMTAQTNITTSSSNSVLNYTNILGFAEDAISDGNTGTIKLPGNVVANQSGLTAGTYYYHKADGTLATSGDSDIYKAKAGIAVSSSKLVIADPNQQS